MLRQNSNIGYPNIPLLGLVSLKNEFPGSNIFTPPTPPYSLWTSPPHPHPPHPTPLTMESRSSTINITAMF